GPPQRDPVLLPAERAERVTPGVLDLDDVRAEVGEQGADDGAGEQDRRVDDLEAGERTWACVVLVGQAGLLPARHASRERAHPPAWTHSVGEGQSIVNVVRRLSRESA